MPCHALLNLSSGHISWHASQGLALQIIESPDQIRDTIFTGDAKAKLDQTCREWEEWRTDPETHFLQDDSGI